MSIQIEYWSPKELGLSPEQFIERCARVAYRSEGKMTNDSYKDFIQRVVVKHRDHSVAEHVGFSVVANGWEATDIVELLQINPLIDVVFDSSGVPFLGINGRQILELAQQDILGMKMSQLVGTLKAQLSTLLVAFESYITTPLQYFMGTDIFLPSQILATYYIKGISRVTETQWVRHRRMSYTVMSGRGVDIREQPFVAPESYLKAFEQSWVSGEALERYLENATKLYAMLRDQHGVSRQDARYILPQGTSTEMVVTASLKWWNYFFTLRSKAPAQWEIKEVSRMIQNDLHKRYPQHVDAPPTEEPPNAAPA